MKNESTMNTTTADEVLRKKNKNFRNRCLNLWNDETAKVVKHLQKQTVQSRETYSKLLISNIETDVHGYQSVACKLVVRLNKTENDQPA